MTNKEPLDLEPIKARVSMGSSGIWVFSQSRYDIVVLISEVERLRARVMELEAIPTGRGD